MATTTAPTDIEDTEAPPVSPNPKGLAEIRAFAKRVLAEFKQHYVPVKAAGVAFFAFLALIPTLVAIISVYGLVADPDEITEQITDATESLPPETSQFLSDQMSRIADSSGGAVGLALAGSILVALLSASAAVKHVMSTLNVIYEFPETRGGVKLRLTAYGLTAGAVVTIVVGALALGALPAILAAADIGALGRWLATVAVYPLMLLAFAVALSILYWVGPDRQGIGQFRFFSVGAIIATVLWLVGTAAFSIFVTNFGNYNETYGIFAGIIVLLLWFNLTARAVLLGAEIDATRLKLHAEAEAERRRTTNPPVMLEDGERTQAGKAALVGVLVGAAIGGITGRG
ncbi:MAG: YihY/virulence factor BrkB family protein [Actinomycetota bacterium]